MKKRTWIVISVLVVCLFGVLFAACAKKKPVNPDPTPSTSDNAGILDGTGENYEESTYSYSFVTNGGSAVAGGTLYKNEYIPTPQTTSKDGYRFTGWYYDEDCTRLCEFINLRMPAHDITFYAGWQKYYSIAFETNGGNALDPITGDAGDSAGEAPVPVRDGYVFEGWYSDKDLTEGYLFSTIPEKDITLYAKWRALKTDVQVSFYDDNGLVETKVCREGDVLNLPTCEPSGADARFYVFSGWAVGSASGKVIAGTYKVTAQNTALYAVFKQDQAWAKVTLLPSDYLKTEYRETGISFFAKKGFLLSEGQHTFTQYDGTTPLFDLLFEKQALEAQEIDYLGLISVLGVTFDPEEDMVIGDMTLQPDLFSRGLNFKGVYLAPDGSFVYGEKGVRDFLGLLDGATISPAQWSLFSKVCYMVESYTNSGSVTDIYIPSYYLGTDDATGKPDEMRYEVALIGEGVFRGRTDLQKVVLPSTIQVIEAYAFEGCTSLQSVNFPDGLAQVGDSAFKNCESLATVSLPETLYIYGYKVFENTAFEKAMFAKSPNSFIYFNNRAVLYACNATLPQGFKYVLEGATLVIAGGAFEGQTGLTGIILYEEKGVEIIGAGAFKGCVNLEEIYFRSCLVAILDEAFDGCSKLKTLTKSDYLQEVGAHAFRGCTSLESFYFGLYFTTLGEGAFEGCTSLKTAEMFSRTALNPSTGYTVYYCTMLSYIPANAFKDCVSLTEFRVMDFVTEIAGNAFAGCTALRIVYLGNTTEFSMLERVKKDAFAGCLNLRRIIVARPADIEPGIIVFEDGFMDESNDTFYIQVSARAGSNTLASYQESSEKYADKFTTYNSAAPVITVLRTEVAASASDRFVIDVDFLKQYASAEDTTNGNIPLTPADQLVWSVVSVVYNGEALEANEDGTYDLSQPGLYIVNFSVADIYGLASTSHIDVIVA